MYHNDLNIQLCSLSNRAKIEFLIYDKIKNYNILISWSLYQFIEEGWIGMDGVFMEPCINFNENLTAEFFKTKLNTNQCFDFEYLPLEGDILFFNKDVFTKYGKKLKKQYPREYISFIFRSGLWVIDVYDPFYTTTKEIKKGLLKVI